MRNVKGGMGVEPKGRKKKAKKIKKDRPTGGTGCNTLSSSYAVFFFFPLLSSSASIVVRLAKQFISRACFRFSVSFSDEPCYLFYRRDYEGNNYYLLVRIFAPILQISVIYTVLGS